MHGRMATQTHFIRRGWELVGLLSLLTFAALFLGWVTLHPWGGARGMWFPDLMDLAASIGGGIMTFILAWRKRGRNRIGWLLIGGGAFCWGLGQIYRAPADLILKQPAPFPSPADIGYLAMIPLVFAGLLLLSASVPSAFGRTHHLMPHLINLTVVITGALLFAFGFSASIADQDILAGLGLVTLALVIARQVVTMHENDRLNQETQRSFRSLVQNSSDIITIVDTDLTIRYLSPSITRIMGYDDTELIGKSLTDYIHSDDVARALEMILRALTQEGNTPPFAWRQRHRDGSWRHTETISTNLLHDADVRGIVLTTRDISERVELNEQLAYQALHDPLTGLANRTLFCTQVDLAMKKMERTAKPLAVLFLDLDNFKTINDSLGHAAGDHLLTVVAARLVQSLRASDVAARLGGDEFAVLLEAMHSFDDAGEVATRIITEMRQPTMLDGKEIFVNLSIGIALYDSESEDADGLLRNADMAMYTAKRRNKGHFEVFQPHMREVVLRRIQMETDLQKAIARQEFTLHYQPIIDMQTGKISSVEALVRWEHPTLGMIPPLEFISIAEEAGVIVPLGRWVLQEACKQARRWQQDYAPFATLTMNVNLSARQLQDEGLVDDIKTILLQTRLDPHTLVLEITESVLIVEIDTALERLRAIRALGVRLAIDDFGTGYSSLSYLRDFPVDMIKIDKSFVDTIGAEPDADAILHTIASLGDTLNLYVVAEGIEEQRQFSHLQNLGCEYGQGYLFSKPLKQDALEALFARESLPAAEQSMAA